MLVLGVADVLIEVFFVYRIFTGDLSFFGISLVLNLEGDDF